MTQVLRKVKIKFTLGNIGIIRKVLASKTRINTMFDTRLTQGQRKTDVYLELNLQLIILV